MRGTGARCSARNCTLAGIAVTSTRYTSSPVVPEQLAGLVARSAPVLHLGHEVLRVEGRARMVLKSNV